MKIYRGLYLFVAISILLGCSAALVPYTSDPDIKLEQVKVLVDVGRAIPAEKIVLEAIEIYESRNDEIGLANAYRVYGIFYASDAYQRYKWLWKQRGNYDANKDKPTEYFRKSLEIFKKHNKLDQMTDLEYRLAIEYKNKGFTKEACESLQRSMSNHVRHRQENPSAQYIIPSGYSSVEQYIGVVQNAYGCNSP